MAAGGLLTETGSSSGYSNQPPSHTPLGSPRQLLKLYHTHLLPMVNLVLTLRSLYPRPLLRCTHPTELCKVWDSTSSKLTQRLLPMSKHRTWTTVQHQWPNLHQSQSRSHNNLHQLWVQSRYLGPTVRLGGQSGLGSLTNCSGQTCMTFLDTKMSSF